MRHLAVYFAIIFTFPTLCWGQIICGNNASSSPIDFNLLNLGPEYNPVLNSFSLDIDNDNVNDIKFEKYHACGTSHSNNDTWISNLNSVEFIVTLTDSISIDTVQRGTSINNSLNWKSASSRFHVNSDDYSLSTQYHHGIFDTIYRFIGFRKTSSNICGWICVKLLNDTVTGHYRSHITGLNIKSIGKSFLQPQTMEYEVDQNVLLLPVPASNAISIFLTADKKEFSKARLVNSFGQVVKEIDLNFIDKTTTINIEDLPIGIYFLKLFDSDQNEKTGSVIKRFVIAR